MTLVVGRWWQRYHAAAFCVGLSLVLAVAVLAGSQIWLWWQIRSAKDASVNGKPEVAISYLTRAIRSAPSSAEAHYLLAVAERRSGHLDRVPTLLQRAALLGWSRDDIERQLLLAIAQNGDLAADDSRLRALMARRVSDETAEEIYEALAIGYLKTYRLKEAWECLSYWSEWQPRAIFPRLWRADICRRINNRADEEREYRTILAVESGNCAARGRLAEVLKESNRVDEARKEYEKCLATCHVTPSFLIGLAECHRRLANSNSAILILNQALALHLTSNERSAILYELGQIDADEGRLSESISRLEQAARLTPHEVQVAYALSQAYARSGDEMRSRELFERSERIRVQSARAEEITQQLLKTPDHAELRYEIGKIMLDLGMKDEAAGWLRTAIQIQPTHQLAQEALAACQAELAAARQPDLPATQLHDNTVDKNVHPQNRARNDSTHRSPSQ